MEGITQKLEDLAARFKAGKITRTQLERAMAKLIPDSEPDRDAEAAFEESKIE